jgi:hypothetical protein
VAKNVWMGNRPRHRYPDFMPDTTDLWSSRSDAAWRQALDRYDDVVATRGVEKLPALDRWYRDDLPDILRSRAEPYLTSSELVKLTEWKMARGVWRAPNLVRVRGNPPELVREVSANALAGIPHPTKPISILAKLDGVGPATASAAAAAAAPEHYPFFDELVAAQVPALGKVAWTLGYYARYADALRERARDLGGDWTPALVAQALWAHSGGKPPK